MKTIYVTQDNKATISCPNCGKTKEVDVSKYMDIEKPVKIKYRFKCDKCNCGTRDCQGCDIKDCSFDHQNTVLLERRKFYRKSVNLNGKCRPNKGKEVTVVITDISRTGLKFKLYMYNKEINIDDRLEIEFNLDDRSSTSIQKEVLVRKINGLSVGAEFTTVQPYNRIDQAIGFYLMN